MTIKQQVGCVPRAEQSQQGPVWPRQWHRVRSTHGVRYGGYIQAEDTEWQRFDASGLRDGTGVYWKELVSGRMSPLRCLTLGLAEIEPGKILPAHSHEPEEVYHVLEGEGRCTIESVSYELRAGGTLFIPGGAVHQKESTGEKPLRFLFSFPVDQISDVAYHFVENESGDNDAASDHVVARRTETDPGLNNPELTPGTGMLPEIGSDGPNAQPSN
ncbi:cupin domain-containing protein [Pseudomonas putida]